MSLLLNLKFCRSKSTRIFLTFFPKLYVRNLSKFKNNFIYRNDFKKAFNNVDSDKNSGGRIVSADLLYAGKKDYVKSRRKTTISSLQYKGEILFGIHPVYLAILKHKRKLHQLFIRPENGDKHNFEHLSRKQEILNLANSFSIPVRNVDSRSLNYLAPGAVHQGICLDASPLCLPGWSETGFQKISETDIPLWLVLDEILDPMNVGAIIRSAYYFGVKKLFVVRGNSCKLSPTVSKASSGVLEIIDIHQIENLQYFIQIMKSQHFHIISSVAYLAENKTTEAIDVSDYVLKEPTVLILGNEGRGISKTIQELCDGFLSIHPFQNLHQGVDSLNVSVATGVILHSLSKSWKDSLK